MLENLSAVVFTDNKQTRTYMNFYLSVKNAIFIKHEIINEVLGSFEKR